jgi:hypothetical protein
MTYEEFFELAVASRTPLPIMLQDGRAGLCNHFTETDVTIDAYRGNQCEQLRLPYSSISDAGGGALVQVGDSAPIGAAPP